MRVTEVKVFPVSDDKLKAFVSIVLDNCFMVNDIKVIEGRDGRFISMPSRRKRNGKFKDIAHPLNSDTRQMLEGEILEEYDRLLNGDQPPRKAKRSKRKSARREEKDAQPAEQQESGSSTSETPSSPPVPETTEDSTLEEVTEKHLSDSFWTS